MNFKKLAGRIAILSMCSLALIACNEDFNDIGSSIVDHTNFEALKYNHVALSAHSEKINRIQSNGLSSYALGVYNDPVYGKKTANVLTQLRLSRENPSFGDDAELDSVILSIPYYSTVKKQTETSSEYDLDSVFGKGSVALSIFRSNYFLRDYDPGEDYGSQKYFSDEMDKFEQNLDGSALYMENEYRPSKEELVLAEPEINPETGENDTTRVTPRLRVKLPLEYFKEQIFDKEGSDVLLTNANFVNYFRGLYFKTEDNGTAGVFSLLNFNSDEANVTFFYKNKVTNFDEDDPKYKYSTYKLNFGSQIVNVYDTEYKQLPAADDNLYVKGGQGSMAVVDLFTDENQLDSLRTTDWLINEANLKFYVNEGQMNGVSDYPQRLFIYDVNNKRVLKDYAMAGGVKDNDIVDSRTIHLGRLEKDDQGSFYKMKITNYVNDIINNDSTNTKLGLVVSQNVNIEEMTGVETENEEASKLPKSSVLSRNGTVLHGTDGPLGKALKLEIYYTEPN